LGELREIHRKISEQISENKLKITGIEKDIKQLK
jgi:hypothetical protein